MNEKRFFISLPDQSKVSARLDAPSESVALLVLAHGAGAGMDQSGMEKLSSVLNAQGIATLRFQFPYMERGSKRPDSPPVATAVIEAVVKYATEKFPQWPLFAGGKSFGGRMTTTAAALGKLPAVRGILCFGFPLHPAKKPGIVRAEHIAKLKIPTLWIQGTRDDLADLTLVKKVVKRHAKILSLVVLEGADHSFNIRKSSGDKPEEIWDVVGKVSQKFCALSRFG